jgi:hypothetical protein
MITILVSLLVGFIGGFIAGLKNASSSKVEKAKTILDVLKNR